MLLNNEDIRKVTQDHKQELDAPIILEEIKEVIAGLKVNTSPIPDGLRLWNFIKKIGNTLSGHLFELFLSYLKGRKHTAFGAMARVILLPKESKDLRLPNSYRPVSLLNVDYKILTSILTTRLKSMLPYCIHQSQAGFIKGREVRDNLRKVCNMVNHVHETKVPTLFAFSDAEKAFDRLQWDFMQAVLAKMDFGPVFLEWINIIYSNQGT